MTSINELFAGRVLEFTRAEAILKSLVVDIDNMQTSLTTNLGKRDNTLGNHLAAFRSSAVDQWLKGTGTGMSAPDYERARDAAIGRARSLERRAYDAAEAAAALATLLEHTEPLITPDDLVARIDAAAIGFYDGTYTSDAPAETDLIAVWQELTPSPLVSPEAVELLRRHYDTHITGPYTGRNLPNLYATVSAWRSRHLAAPAWDAATWAYAVATIRSWDEAANLWHGLGDGTKRESLTAPQNMRLRNAIADRVRTAVPDSSPAPRELVEAVTEFDTAHTWLMMRLRATETMADLVIVAESITGRARDVDGGLTLMRALARRFDLLTGTAPDADAEGDGWAPVNVLGTQVANWRDDLYREALSATIAGGPDYDANGRYVLIDCALADARHTGHTNHVDTLLDRITRIADAAADHILTPEHIAKLRAACAQYDTTAIDINGGTTQ